MGSHLATGITLVAAGLAMAAPPAEDGLRSFRKTLAALQAREDAWWKDLPAVEEKAHREFHRPLRQQYAEKVTEPRGDFAPIRALYEQALAFETERGEAYGKLALSGHAGALAALWKEALAAADLQEEAERANLSGELKQVAFLLRQGPSIRLHALETRRRVLSRVFAAIPGAVDFLGGPEAWKEAREKDLSARSTSRRVYVADSLAVLAESAGRARLEALLADEAFEVRIAAIEGLGAGPEDLPFSATALLGDASPAVRFALLDVLRSRPPVTGAWMEPLARAYLEGRGRFRADALRVLRSASGRAAGDDPEGWKEWLEQTRAAREDGTFRRPEASTEDVAAPGATFWGIPVESDRVLLAADGWWTLVVPADHSFQSTRHVTDWITGQRGWRKDRESVQDVVARLVPPFLEGLSADAGFSVLLLGKASNRMGDVTWFDRGGALPPTPVHRQKAKEFVADFHIGTTEFFQQGLQILLDTREPDTAVLVTGGYLRTDRFLLPEALVSEFRRRNRFRRLRLHIVHVLDHGPESAGVLESLARSTGGTLARALVPPPR